MGRPKKRDGTVFPSEGVDTVRAGSISGVPLMEVRTTGSLLEPNSSAPSALHRGSCELSEQGLIFGV